MPTTINGVDVKSALSQARASPPRNRLTPSPEDWRDCWIYFLMVDRFNNPSAAPVIAFDGKFGGFQGGTIEGMRQNLAKPGGTIGREITVMADVVAVNAKAKTVTLKGPQGNTVDVIVEDPEQMKNIRKGDQVAGRVHGGGRDIRHARHEQVTDQ